MKKSEYFSNKIIGSGRKDKICIHCQGKIPVGESHYVHTFEPDPNFVPDPNVPPKPGPGIAYRSFPTHIDCLDNFLNSLEE